MSSKNDVTLIVYDSPKPPRYIKINKGIVQSLLFLVPFLVIFSIFFSLFTSFYAKRKVEVVRSKEPEIIAGLKDENTSLQSQLSEAQSINKELSQKIAVGASSEADGILDFAFLATPIGMKDIRNQDMAKIENFSNQIINNKIVFKFDLLNNLPTDAKLGGYILVLQYHSYGLGIYPNIPLGKNSSLIRFNQGESFRVSRFRPVVADFPLLKNASKVWYKILIFSTRGDLISIKETEEYPLN